MAHKKKHTGHVPPANKSRGGLRETPDQTTGKGEQTPAEVSSAQEQDPNRRLGDFTGKGEHSMQEPGGKNDANH